MFDDISETHCLGRNYAEVLRSAAPYMDPLCAQLLREYTEQNHGIRQSMSSQMQWHHAGGIVFMQLGQCFQLLQ